MLKRQTQDTPKASREASRSDLSQIMRAILSDKVAKNSYSNLKKNGLKSTDLFEELVGMVAAVAVGSLGKPNKRSTWYSGSGKTPKTLAYFPGRLRAMAGEIERLNTYPLFRPDKEGSICKPDKKSLVVGFMELPVTLRQFAAHVDDLSRSTSGLFSRNKKGRMGPMGQVLDCLRWLVRKETGRERPAVLQRILKAAVQANLDAVNGNLDFETDLNFEAELKSRAYRERKQLGPNPSLLVQSRKK